MSRCAQGGGGESEGRQGGQRLQYVRGSALASPWAADGAAGGGCTGAADTARGRRTTHRRGGGERCTLSRRCPTARWIFGPPKPSGARLLRFQDETEADIYEEVDEREYESRLAGDRQQAQDFIEDDGTYGSSNTTHQRR